MSTCTFRPVGPVLRSTSINGTTKERPVRSNSVLPRLAQSVFRSMIQPRPVIYGPAPYYAPSYAPIYHSPYVESSFERGLKRVINVTFLALAALGIGYIATAASYEVYTTLTSTHEICDQFEQCMDDLSPCEIVNKNCRVVSWLTATFGA